MEIRQGMIFVVLVFALSACATPAINTISLVPAKSTEAATLKQVAVLPFEGQDGKRFASEIEGVLASINIGDKQYFALVDRTVIEKILDEETRLSQSGVVDPKTAARIGRAVGAKGIYTGVITTANSIDNNYSAKRDRCVNYNEKEKECKQWQEYTVSCTKRSAAFSFTPKLIEVETGRVVYADNISGTSEAQGCQDDQKPLPSGVELLGRAKQSAKATFRTDIAPSYVSFRVKLMDLTDGITSKDVKQKLKNGLDYAKNGRLDRACEIWGEARILSPDSPSLIYNLGVCAETAGDLEQALDLYKKSDKLLNKPDDRITVALRRASSAIQNKKKLNEQK